MFPSRGRVPNFSLKPHPIYTSTLILIIISGILLALSFYSKEDGSGRYAQHATLTLIITFILSVCLLIAATSKAWFPHLWYNSRTRKNHRRRKHYPHHRHH